MRTLTTNRLLLNSLRTVCCAGALTACSTWAAIVPWQLDASGHAVATKNLSQANYTSNVRGTDGAVSTDASRQFSLKSPSASEATVTDTLKTRLQNEADRQDSRSSLPQGGTHSDQSMLFAASNAQTQSAAPMQSGGALASAFDEEFVSVPTVQFDSVISGPKNGAMTALAAVGSDPAPVPEMSALFPIVGLIAAVACTRILRRRRAAQQNASRVVA